MNEQLERSNVHGHIRNAKALRVFAAVIMLNLSSAGCAVEGPSERETSRVQKVQTLFQDKKDVMDFLRRFMQAVKTDAFADPEKLKAALKLELLELEPVQGSAVPKGAAPGAERIKFGEQSLRKIKTNVVALDELAEHMRYAVRTAGPNVGRWVFIVDQLDQKICINPVDVESVFGKRNFDTPLPYHPLRDFAHQAGYRFESAHGVKSVRFTYFHVAGGICVRAFAAGFQP